MSFFNSGGGKKTYNVTQSFIWREEKTVAQGNKTMVLTNPYKGENLLIYDKKYGAKWERGLHWNISGQTITFLSSMPETLIFEIINIG